MSTPRSVAAYPPSMLAALERLIASAEPLVIPSSNPSALRLQFYGLKRALRAESRLDLADTWQAVVNKNPPSLTLSLREFSEFDREISAALGEKEKTPSPSSDIEAAFLRILGKT